MKPQPNDLYAGDLFGEMYQAESEAARPRLTAYLPGLAVCGTVALAAAWLADHYSFPLILLGLLLGLALSFVSEDARTNPGLDFASRHALRMGIVLLGLQVTVLQVAELGWLPFLGLILVMTGAFFAAVSAASWVGEGREAGILAGGATAICGASAALALYGIIGQDRLSQTRFSIALVGVALASAIAMTISSPSVNRMRLRRSVALPSADQLVLAAMFSTADTMCRSLCCYANAACAVFQRAASQKT